MALGTQAAHQRHIVRGRPGAFGQDATAGVHQHQPPCTQGGKIAMQPLAEFAQFGVFQVHCHTGFPWQRGQQAPFAARQ